jgi:hypothetical protein
MRLAMQQHRIGDIFELCPRLVIADDLRLVRQVATGHHHGPVDLLDEEEM